MTDGKEGRERQGVTNVLEGKGMVEEKEKRDARELGVSRQGLRESR